MMKRTKVTSGGTGSNDKHLKCCSNKLKSGITFDDQTLSDVGPSKEASNVTVGKTSDKTERLSRGKRMLIKREKNIELSKSPVMITSARKKGRSPDDSRVVKALPEGGEGDSIILKTPKSVEKVVHVSKELHPPLITCVVGLQCKVVTTMLQTKNVNVKSPTMNPPNEGKEVDGGSGTLKRKRGRPFKSKSKKPKTPLAATLTLTHENGDALTKTPVEKVANTTIKKYQSVKRKRGKRRKIRSININIVSPHSLEDSSLKQKSKPIERLGLGLELTILDEDQPLSMWFEGKHRNGEKLPFEKRSTTLWATLEAMDVFQKIPQKPHFRPLEKEKECTREGHAISKMVSYVRVVESISQQQLTLEDRRSAFEESLEALGDLESHGFDVKVVRERVSGLLRIKEKQELLEQESKKVKKQMEVERVEGVRIDKEIELVDQQVVALLEKRAQVLKRKEKKDAEVGGLEAQIEEIHRGISEARCNFDELAAASLCG